MTAPVRRRKADADPAPIRDPADDAESPPTPVVVPAAPRPKPAPRWLNEGAASAALGVTVGELRRRARLEKLTHRRDEHGAWSYLVP